MIQSDESIKRSHNMSRIRAKDTTPELLLRKAFFKLGYRYRVNHKNLPGKPDLVFPKFKTAIFVHGCFWHQHKHCRDGHTPKTRKEYWIPKLQKNVERDALNESKLINLGWNVQTIWECQIENNIDEVVASIVQIFNNI